MFVRVKKTTSLSERINGIFLYEWLIKADKLVIARLLSIFPKINSFNLMTIITF